MLPGSIPLTVTMIDFRSSFSIALVLLISGRSLFSASFCYEEAVFTDEVKPLQGQLFLPRNLEQPVAAMVVVHGGAWVRRSGEVVSISKQLARQGIAAFNIT